MTQGVGLAIAPVATSTNLAPEARKGESMSYMGNSISVPQLYAPPFGVFLYVTLCDTWFVTHGTGITFIAASVLGINGLSESTVHIGYQNQDARIYDWRGN